MDIPDCVVGTPISEKTCRRLVEAALKARQMSYSPYSGFQVGAALLGVSGQIYTGCNIENCGYSATNCAERTAVFKAVSEGERRFLAIAIVGGPKSEQAPLHDYVSPCGICRQVLAEFCGPDLMVLLGRDVSDYQCHTLGQLLPMAFTPQNLK